MEKPKQTNYERTDCHLKPIPLDTLPEKPLVSVLINNYNYEQYVGQAIQSVLEQNFQNFEVCVCDDGSTDGSIDVIKSYALRDQRIRLFTQPNRGQAAALNVAFQNSIGDLIALLDSDDIWLPTKLSRVVDQFRLVPGAGMVTHRVLYVDKHLTRIRPQPVNSVDGGWLAPALLQGLRPRMPPTSGITLRRRAAESIFPLHQRHRISADVTLRELAALIVAVSAVDSPLSLYRIHGQNSVGLRRTAIDKKHLREFLTKTAEDWQERKDFILREHGQLVTSELWQARLASEFHLTEDLLEGKPLNQAYLRHLGSRWLIPFWRIAFASPVRAQQGLLRLRWGPSPVKTLLSRAKPLRWKSEGAT